MKTQFEPINIVHCVNQLNSCQIHESMGGNSRHFLSTGINDKDILLLYYDIGLLVTYVFNMHVVIKTQIESRFKPKSHPLSKTVAKSVRLSYMINKNLLIY
jgi:hypothetical protein